ncbi:anhydro-N-acetylmuramic acid kinase [Polaribacter sp.]|jgi:anhydro-N-acetylmuramic acid kinase|uniref:anhydro-N-acetylmuramic acid kinase n=1 Tax=Polaribacter sp. TaxID=1920175 RepID=UPI00404861A8
MKKNKIFAIGVMSGSSLDGIDLAFVSFEKENYQNFEIVFAETIPYSNQWKHTLRNAIRFSAHELKELSINYGVFLGDKINQFMSKFSIKKVDFVASHGHTIFHQPEKSITLQIGDGQTIANKTNQKVVCDFRSQDVALGGQGAPLVPIGDELLFPGFDYCLNLGGFANISYKENNQRIAFDICPVNVVLNFYAIKLGVEYDANGAIAKSGIYHESLFHRLNSLEYFSQKPPKSLGIEWVQKEVFPILEASNETPSSILRTYTDHIAWQIAKVIPENKKVLCTGGGTYNSYLIKKVSSTKKLELIIPDKNLIEFKEALIFAFLGLLRIDNQINCLQSVTGAKKDHSSGVIFYQNL